VGRKNTFSSSFLRTNRVFWLWGHFGFRWFQNQGMYTLYISFYWKLY
jgi:hypothetical protein